MFSWICPQCGREVPPSYTECPDCVAKGKLPPSPAVDPAQPPANVPPPQQPPPQPVYVTQPVQQSASAPYAPYPAQYGQPQQQYAPPPQQYPQYAPTGQYPQPPQPPYPPHAQYPPQYAPPPAPPRRAGLPTWLLTAAFTLAFVGLVGGIYWLVGSSRGGQAAGPPSNIENPAAKPVAKTSPVQKYVEISGIRFTEDAKKKNIGVKFLVTNHSDADLSGLAGNVTVWARTNKSEEEPVGTFSFTADVPPDASKEVTAPLTTKLKMYELPDWQNVTTDVQITAPQ